MLLLTASAEPTAGRASIAAEFRGTVVDDLTGKALPARVYLRDRERSAWLTVESAVPEGSALPYREQWVRMPGIEDQHTTLSAHPFRANLQPGEYTIEIEHGKEYLPRREELVMRSDPLTRVFRLRRWIDLASLGWYSGETHVHRRIHELTNVMQAENLNVAFPVTFWTTRSDRAPDLAPSTLRQQGPSPFGPREDRGFDPLWIDRDHVIVPRNTEYEIFSIGDRPHTLGALFILNHQRPLTHHAPPVAAIAAQAHAEGALLDLDKHSWPWSLMLIPVAQVDLFELSNNSVWRAPFGFKQTSVAPAPWMQVEQEAPGVLSEWGWLNFGFEVYYALLNCGFQLAPSAGTASGVHPVPLGYSRVYVQLDGGFSLDRWLAGLRAGRSFVTTGPMLLARVNKAWPGGAFRFSERGSRSLSLEIETTSEKPLSAIEIVVNGRVRERLNPPPIRIDDGAWRCRVEQAVEIDDPSWLAVRCIEPQPDGRRRFAHTGVWQVAMGGRPVAPRPEQVEWLVDQLEREIERSRPVLAPDALAEFEEPETCPCINDGSQMSVPWVRSLRSTLGSGFGHGRVDRCRGSAVDPSHESSPDSGT